MVKFDPRAEDDIENDISLFKSSSKLLMGPVKVIKVQLTNKGAEQEEPCFGQHCV